LFKPVKLLRITIQVPEKHMSEVLGILGDLRLLHLININETHLGKLGYIAAPPEGLLNRYKNIVSQCNKLIKELNVKAPVPPLDKAPRPEKDIFLLEDKLSSIASKLHPILEEEKQLKRQVGQKDELFKRLELIAPAQVDFTRLSRLLFTSCRFGIIPPENLQRLEESLSDIHHALIKIQTFKDKLVLAAFCLKEDLPVLERALKSAFFNEITLPSHLTGTVYEIMKRLQQERIPLMQRLQELEKEKKDARRRYGQELLIIREKAYLAKLLIEAASKFGKIDHTYLLTGWIPVDLYKPLKEKILNATGKQAIVDAVDPEDLKEVRSGIVKIPILFNNPLLIRPFERLTTLYGIPSYQEVEPTVFLAISFVILFGMMFGDIGHGLVLFLAGFYIFKRLYKYMDYGIILMECGVSSMLFGLLYGSIFGVEDLVPALWLHPMRDINKFMLISAAIGVAMISLGFILNLINIFRAREYNKLLSASGLSGALLYWLLAGLGIRYLTSGPPGSMERLVAGLVAGLLLFIMIVERPIRVILKRKRQKQVTKSGPSMPVLVLESVIEVLDQILRFLANTVSFVRVAAFALTHAALFLGVFSIADMLSHGTQKGVAYILTLVLGNIVIILLEAMVVSIQTIRLEYYEFFSKFFRGGGTIFRPIVVHEHFEKTGT